MAKLDGKTRSFRYILLIVLVVSLSILGILIPGSTSQVSELKAKNTSIYLGNGLWMWTIFLEGAENTIGEIECVKYIPHHPKAPKPKSPICKKGEQQRAFGYTDRWYASVKFNIEVTFRNSKPLIELEHRLNFTSPEIDEEKKLQIYGGNSANELKPGLYDWRIFIRGEEDQLDQIQCVEYKLLPSFLHPIMEICEKGTGPYPFMVKAASWGTFTVRIRVYLKNGESQYLTHPLSIKP